MAASIALPAPREAWRPAHNPWLIALTVTLATFMEVLDTSIANVALPHIAGSLGASSDESTWVLTSYLVSNAIVLPISAWLATRIGRKRFYMSCVALFATSSFFCGLAPTLGTLIIFRVLQGAGGGGLQPSEQAILADTFPASKRGMAFAMYGMAVVVAPAIGPTLGGWITDNYSWRWIFYINVPISVLSLYLTHRLVEDPPYLREEKIRQKGLHVDYIGLGLIAVGIGFLQIVLDKGQEADWFGSHWITALLILAIGLLVAWVIWEWRHPNPIVELKLLKNRNFAAASFFMFILGMVLYGTTVLIPQFLQLLLGYSATSAGEALAGGGFIMMLTMPIAGMLVSKGDARIMMSCGFAATALSLYYMATHISLGMDFRTAAMLRVYQTFGLAFYIHSVEHTVVRWRAADEKQPDLKYDQFHPQHWRQYRHRSPRHVHHAYDTATTIVHGGAFESGQPDVPQHAGWDDRDVTFPGSRRVRGVASGVCEDRATAGAASNRIGLQRRNFILGNSRCVPHSAGFHHETSERSRRCRAPRSLAFIIQIRSLFRLVSAATNLFVGIRDA